MRIQLIIALVLMVNISFSQTKNFIDQPYLETTARVDTLIEPDLIYLNILISEKDERNRISLEELENKMALKLESLGINLSKQLTLTDLASNFKKYFLKQKEVLKRKSYHLKLHDAQTAGRVLVGLEEIGISNVSLERTEYSKIDELKLELKSKAVEKAKKQAEYLVKPLKQKILNALYISDNSFQIYNDYDVVLQEVVLAGYSSKKKHEYEAIDIEFKPIRVESEVSIKFRIE